MEPITAAVLLDIVNAQVRLVELGNNLSAMIDEAARVAVRLTQAEGAVVELVEGEEIVYRSASGIAEAQLGLRMPLANSLSGQCVLHQTHAACNDSETDDRVNREACRKVGLRAMVIVPLRSGGRTPAVMKLVWAEPRQFDQNEVEIAQLMANMMAALMHQSALEGQDVLQRRLTVDPPTGAANRASFYEQLRIRLKGDGVQPGRVGVALLRIDGLAAHGPATAAEVMRRIESECASGDMIARVAEHEFAIILGMAVRRTVVNSQLLRISHAISREPLPSDDTARTRLMLHSGSALSPDDGDSAVELVHKAYAALNHAEGHLLRQL